MSGFSLDLDAVENLSSIEMDSGNSLYLPFIMAFHQIIVPRLVARVRELEAENEVLARMVPAEAWVSDRELTPEEYEHDALVSLAGEDIKEIQEALK